MAELEQDENMQAPADAVRFVLPIDLNTLDITSLESPHLLDVAMLMEACFQHHQSDEIAEAGRRAEQRLFNAKGLAMLPSTVEYVKGVTGAATFSSVEQGLFAVGRSFKPNATVALAYGCILPKKHISKDQLRYAVQLEDGDQHLVPPFRSFFALTNHSTTPNAKFVEIGNRVRIVAKCPIAFGDEVTVDY